MERIVTIPDFIKTQPKNWDYKTFYDRSKNTKFSLVPKSLENSLHPDIDRYINKIKSHSGHPFYVARTSEAIICCHNSHGSITLLNRNGDILKDISTNYDFFEERDISDTHHIPKTSVLLSTDSSSNYYHWMCQVLPRVDLLKKFGLLWESVDNIIVQKNQAKFILDSLSSLKIPTNKIHALQPNSCYQFEDLIIPCKPNRHVHLSHWSVNFLRKTFLKSRTGPQDNKIYISRNPKFGRSISNEEEILPYIEALGYKQIFLEGMPIKEQAELFNSASSIISCHGAALTNLVFCQPNTKVFELFNSSYFLPLYWNISNILKLQYHYYISRGANKGREGKNDNIEIPSENLIDFLEL